MFPPERIICLTEETVETLYLLGEERRIVGVSGYAVRPARVRREKPRVSAFISADFEKILAFEPDLVLAFSDLQADIAANIFTDNTFGLSLSPAPAIASTATSSPATPWASRCGQRPT